MASTPGKSFDELLNQYLEGTLTDAELVSFQLLMEDTESKATLKNKIEEQLHSGSLSGLADDKREPIIFDTLMRAIHASNPTEKKSVRFHWKIAAAIILIAFSFPVIYYWKKQAGNPPVQLVRHQKGQYKNDVLPANQAATLTLSDGTIINLDSAKNGALTNQGAATVIKLNGKINYQATKNTDKQIVFNTISTPKGGLYQVLLPDGSAVWLNAASSIYFPTEFNGAERRVKVTGEVYFEVAKDKSKPFIVQAGESEIKVLGTHFNVMSYADEQEMETTLLEGAVAFSNNNRTMLLKPMEQSKLFKDGKLNKTQSINEEDILAWKSGMFHFENSDIYSVMRQLARWYDVEVEYKIKSSGDLFFVEMPRHSKLSSILKVLELTGNIKLEIEGHKIIVS